MQWRGDHADSVPAYPPPPLSALPMRTLPLLALVLLAAPLAAQDDPYRTTFTYDLDRLEEEVQSLGREAPAALRGDLDQIVADYDDLRTAFDGDAVSDPVAVSRARSDYMDRYDRISERVYRARLESAPSRAAYARIAAARVEGYDAQIADLRTRYRAAPDADRFAAAQDLIRLRRQRDAYRDEALRARRTAFDDASRRQATDRLTRLDTQFRAARRSALDRMDNGASGTD